MQVLIRVYNRVTYIKSIDCWSYPFSYKLLSFFLKIIFTSDSKTMRAAARTLLALLLAIFLLAARQSSAHEGHNHDDHSGSCYTRCLQKCHVSPLQPTGLLGLLHPGPLLCMGACNVGCMFVASIKGLWLWTAW